MKSSIYHKDYIHIILVQKSDSKTVCCKVLSIDILNIISISAVVRGPIRSAALFCGVRVERPSAAEQSLLFMEWDALSGLLLLDALHSSLLQDYWSHTSIHATAGGCVLPAFVAESGGLHPGTYTLSSLSLSFASYLPISLPLPLSFISFCISLSLSLSIFPALYLPLSLLLLLF